jgi:hypothetical protein
MTTMDATTVIMPYLVPLVTFAAGYGAVSARLRAVETRMEETVTRREHEALERRLLEIVQELRGLRAEIVAAVVSRRSE